MQANLVVILHEASHDTLRVADRQRALGANAITFESAVIAFDLPIALGIVGAGSHMRHAAEANEALEVLGDELRAIVGDDAGRGLGIPFASSLQNDFDVFLFHFFADIPMHNHAAIPIDHIGDEVECAADIEVGDVEMPMLMGRQRLLKTRSLERFLDVSGSQGARLVEDAINAGRTARHDVGVDHAISEPPVSVERMLAVELENRLFLRVGEPMAARRCAVVSISLPVIPAPFGKGGRPDPDPVKNLLLREMRARTPASHIIDNFVAPRVGNPFAIQDSPLAFFSWICSWSNSAMTSFFC